MAIEILMAACTGSTNETASGLKVTDETTTLNADGVGARFDDDTSLQTGYQVLEISDVYIVNGDDIKIRSSKLEQNSKFSIIFEGIKNYALKDGKAFPGMALQLTDSNQNPIIGESDLLAGYADGLSLEDASVLRATITISDSMMPGNYICSVEITDKNNPEAVIVSTWPFEVE